MSTPEPTHLFSPATHRWFAGAFAGPTPVQARGWPVIQSGAHTLLLAPTGSGKTLAAFLAALDRVCVDARHRAGAAAQWPAAKPGAKPTPPPGEAAPGVEVLYISPLKALATDVEKNLWAPLAGIRRAAEGLGAPTPEVRVSVRTGDTPAKQRAFDRKSPPQILVTTPESLYLMLTSGAREGLAHVHTVIIDEIHAMAGTKRGAHLALSLERLCARTLVEPQRIGLSATQRPLSEIAGFLGGDRPVTIVDAGEPPRLDLAVRCPVPDLDAVPTRAGPTHDSPLSHPLSAPGTERTGAWTVLIPAILDEVLAHRSTIVFTNSRRLCERVSQQLNDLAAERGLPVPVSFAHHGSVAPPQRLQIEDALKRGRIPCIVATSSMELGIDMGAVELVVQVAAPPSVAAGLQRVGRAGHQVGGLSIGRIYPRHKAELLEAAAVAAGMRTGQIEATRAPRAPLDVLAQQIVAACVVDVWARSALRALIVRAWPYRELGEDSLQAVIDLLCGQLHGPEAARPRLSWDRSADTLQARAEARLIVLANAGTIPDRGAWPVHIAPDGPRVGELDEEMVHESRKGDVFVLGASTWRIVEIKRDRISVAPAPGEPGRMPFWRGEGPGRPLDLGRAMGALCGQLDALDDVDAAALLDARCGFDAHASANLIGLLRAQRAEGLAVPTDERVVVERFRDEFGDWRVCVHAQLGARVLAPWALAVAAQLEAVSGRAAQVLCTDDGLVLRLEDGDEPPPLELMLPDPDAVVEQVIRQLEHSSLFAARFREAAGRALLLPRRRPGQRTPLYLQRMRAQALLADARLRPRHPLVLEAYRECLQDQFDLEGLRDVLQRIRDRRTRVDEVETRAPSPFARNLLFSFVASWLYEQDAPLAERRSQALSVDRALLRELLGEDHLEEQFRAEELDELEAELQQTAEGRRARGPDALHDLLRRVGDLDRDEAQARVEGPAEAWLQGLAQQGRAALVRIAGCARWVAVEDLALLRDGLGVVAPVGAPALNALQHADPIEALLLRYARSHAPFFAEAPAARLGLTPAQLGPWLRALEARGLLVSGRFRPGEGRSWCERQVLQRLKRRALARLRGQVEPVEAPVLAALIAAWQGVIPAGPGAGRRRSLAEVLGRLEGAAILASTLESGALRSRMGAEDPAALDALIGAGELVWVGSGAVGPRDGWVRLLRPALLATLAAPPAEEPEGALQRRLLQLLEARGACFQVELLQAVGASAAPAWGSSLLSGALAAHRGPTAPGAADAPPTALGAAPRPRPEEVEAALWDLVWAGWISCDSAAPLRALSRPARPGRGRPQGGAGGRWWSIRRRLADLGGAAPHPTERARVHAALLLERYGVVGAPSALAEGVPGGFSSVYPVLSAMEELGQARRGWFVSGLSGAWFGLPGAVEQLRALREEGGPDYVLSATDPAQAWGAVLPWPEGAAGAMKREGGAWVVLSRGEPRLWLGRGGHSLVVYPETADSIALQPAVEALCRALERSGEAAQPLRRINGQTAPGPALRSALLGAGLTDDRSDGGALRLPVRR